MKCNQFEEFILVDDKMKKIFERYVNGIHVYGSIDEYFIDQCCDSC